jgi:PAS domain-containing protein
MVARANDTLAKIIGVERDEELVGTDLRKYLADPKPFENAIRELVRVGAARDRMATIKTVAGEDRHLLYTASLDEDLATGILVDATDRIAAEEERRRAEAGMRRLERLNAALIENARDGITLLKADGTYEFISPSSVRITGWTLERFGKKKRPGARPPRGSAADKRGLPIDTRRSRRACHRQ